MLSESSSYFSLDDNPYVAQQLQQQLPSQPAPRYAFHFEAPVLVRGDAEGNVTFWSSLPEVLKRLERFPPDPPNSYAVGERVIESDWQGLEGTRGDGKGLEEIERIREDR